VARNDDDNDDDNDDFDPNNDPIKEDGQIQGVEVKNDKDKIRNKASFDDDNRVDDEMVENTEIMVDLNSAAKTALCSEFTSCFMLR
jgi:hypothetical protein